MEFVDLINNVGFPIAVVVYMFWRSYKEEEQHKQEVDNLSTAIDNNTLVIQKLLDKMEE